MTQDKVDMFIMTNQKYLPAEKIVFLKQKLLDLDENRFSVVSTMEFKNPTTLLLVSIFLGSLGIDRFMLGEVGLAFLKLLPLALCGILTIFDWSTVQKRPRDQNYTELMLVW